MNATLRNDSESFETIASSLVEQWFKLMLEEQYQDANSVCTSFIYDYGSALKNRAFETNEDEYDKLMILLVFVKGLHDYTQLCQLLNNNQWHKDNSTVEQVWFKLWDCRERLGFLSRLGQGKVVERLFQNLDDLEFFFQDTFGNGTYLSPGIIVDKYLCSVCHRDSRACSHVAGRLYGGTICSYQPVNPRIDHVALVRIPKDPRCRIWPWHMENPDEGEGAKFKAPILTLFSVDNFLQEL